MNMGAVFMCAFSCFQTAANYKQHFNLLLAVFLLFHFVIDSYGVSCIDKRARLVSMQFIFAEVYFYLACDRWIVSDRLK